MTASAKTQSNCTLSTSTSVRSCHLSKFIFSTGKFQERRKKWVEGKFQFQFQIHFLYFLFVLFSLSNNCALIGMKETTKERKSKKAHQWETFRC
jgi:hypothetical protein